jgi:uncharacterized protein YndB with AHSA1/START domain
MSSCKSQALLDAPVEEIWELVGDPRRHPEWWPKVIEVNGEHFDEGTEYVQVTRSAMGRDETTNFIVERRQDLREIKLRCQMSGTYAHWQMTQAQGGTFVDVEFGMDPKSLGLRLFDGAFGRIYFRRWMEQSVEGLKQAATAGEPSRTTAP